MATTLYLVRHGETMGNRIRRYQPHDMPLTDEGRAQARLVAVRLAEEGPFDAIYASDMARTLETAAAIGSCLGLTPVPDARLRELDTGDWKGIPYTEIDERFPGHRERWIAAGGIERMPGPEGESTTDVHARMTEAFEEYVANHAGGRVILVSHGWALGLLLAAIHDMDYTEAFREQRFQFGNTSVTIVEVGEDGARRCLLQNCTRHLAVAAGNEGSP